MKNQFAIGCTAMILLLLGSSCSSKKYSQQADRVKILPAITRVSGLYFETGDKIGLSIMRSSDTYVENVEMSYDGMVFTAENLHWYDGDARSTLVAYHPYAPSGVPTQISISTDQTLGYAACDLLAARKQNVAPSSATVGMVFRHLMALVDILITNKTTSPVVEVIVGGTVPDAQLNLAALSILPTQGAATTAIKTYVVTQNQHCQAVIIPQQAALTLAVKSEDGKVRTASFNSNDFLQGKRYTINLTVEKELLIPTLSGSVTDWETGGELLPNGSDSEQQPDENPDTGNTMTCQGETYKTVTSGGLVWMAENLRYIPSDVGATGSGAWYPDGKKESVDVYGVLYNFERASMLCPEGWRIPTEDDFKILMPLLDTTFPSSIPLAGIYSLVLDGFNGINTKGYLMGSTAGSKEGNHKHFFLMTGRTPQIDDYPVGNGVSVRFVRSVK